MLVVWDLGALCVASISRQLFIRPGSFGARMQPVHLYYCIGPQHSTRDPVLVHARDCDICHAMNKICTAMNDFNGLQLLHWGILKMTFETFHIFSMCTRVLFTYIYMYIPLYCTLNTLFDIIFARIRKQHLSYCAMPMSSAGNRRYLLRSLHLLLPRKAFHGCVFINNLKRTLCRTKSCTLMQIYKYAIVFFFWKKKNKCWICRCGTLRRHHSCGARFACVV